MCKTETITCPDCDGKGTMFAFGIKYAEGHDGPWCNVLPCGRCRGEKTVPKDMLVWMKNGRKLRRVRRRLGLSFREAADIICVLPSDVSKMESGEIELPDWRFVARMLIEKKPLVWDRKNG